MHGAPPEAYPEVSGHGLALLLIVAATVGLTACGGTETPLADTGVAADAQVISDTGAATDAGTSADGGLGDAAADDASATDGGVPDSALGDAALPDRGRRDADLVDAVTADASRPDADPSDGPGPDAQPADVGPRDADPADADPADADPADADPADADPADADPADADPADADPADSGPSDADPADADPADADPADADPADADPADADPADADPADADPADADPPDSGPADAGFAACGSTPHGGQETRDCFASASVAFGQTCSSTAQSRTCSDGTFDPDYPTCANLTCTVDPPADCGPVAHGASETRECFDAPTVQPPATCTSTTQARICNNGAFDPNWPACGNLSCIVECPPGTNSPNCTPCPAGTFGYDCRYRRFNRPGDQPVVVDRFGARIFTGCDADLTGPTCSGGVRNDRPWQDAVSYCRAGTWDGRDDWDLPPTGAFDILVAGLRGPNGGTLNTMPADIFPGAFGAYWALRSQRIGGVLEGALFGVTGVGSWTFRRASNPQAVLCSRNKRQTIIDTAPPRASQDADATFEFESDSDPAATFECRLAPAAFAPCTSPVVLTGLPDGDHTFEVRATESTGEVDPTPAVWQWISDAIPPDTTINTSPTGLFTGTSTTITFSANEPNVTFECRLDGAAWAACDSPYRFFALADGARTFEVRATDASGRIDATPAMTTFDNVFCGNGFTGPGEACDDANRVGGDYCSATCDLVTGSCGDGLIQRNEDCEAALPCADVAPVYSGGQAPCGASCRADVSGCTVLNVFPGPARDIVVNAPDVVTMRVADVDGASGPDVIVGTADDDTLRVYTSTDATTWTPIVIATQIAGASAPVVADIDANGTLDLVYADRINRGLFWSANPGPGGTTWLQTRISIASIVEAISVADLDGNITPDVISGERINNGFSWYQNQGLSPTWPETRIGGRRLAAVAVQDFDGDGAPDIVAADSLDRVLTLYRNALGAPVPWPATEIAAPVTITDLALTDLDADGDVDLAATDQRGLSGATVLWFENVLGDFSVITRHPLGTVIRSASQVVPADFDGDGDVDLLVRRDNFIAWYENSAGDGTVFEQRIVAAGSSDWVDAADLDSDGDADIIVATDDRVFWFENALP